MPKYNDFHLNSVLEKCHLQNVKLDHCDDLVQNCNISITKALEILQSWTKPSINDLDVKF